MTAFQKLKIPAVFLGTSLIVAGCAATPLGPSVQVMPGPGKTFEAFQFDNASCKQFAGQQVAGQADQANQRAIATGVLTTAVGAATGAAIGGGNGAAVGAGAGAALGTGLGGADNSNAQLGIQQQYDIAFSQCMYAKGESVPGYAPPIATASYSRPTPQADPMVRSVQRELIRLHYLSGGADGFMGPHTSSAISAFESANGLPANGDVSSRLLARLQSTPSQPTVAAAPAWVAPVGATSASATTSSASGWVQPVKTQ